MPPSGVEGVAKFGPFTVSLRTGELQDGERRVRIQGKPLEVLNGLLEHPGELVTRESLYQRLWHGISADYQRGLDTAVKKLRKALQDPAGNPVYVETLPRLGYRFIAPVSIVKPSPPAAMAVRHAGFPLPAPSPANTEAERLYLVGYHCWNKRTPASQKQAREYFLKARQLEPANASYSAAVAQACFMLAWHGVERPVEAIAEAKSAAVTAILHDHSQLLAHLILASVRGAFDYDLRGAIGDLRGLLQRAPDQSFGHLELSVFLAASGAQEEAQDALQKAGETDPVSPTVNAAQGFVRYLGGQFAEAARLGQQAIERDPEFGLARLYYGLALMALGRLHEAIAQFDVGDQLMAEQFEVRALTGLAAALEGDGERARQIDRAFDEIDGSRYVNSYHRALLKDALGMRTAAVELLERACDDHSHWFCLAAVDPRLGSLREDARVQTLIRRIRR